MPPSAESSFVISSLSFEALEALDATLDGHEVRQHAAEPAGVDEMLARAVRGLGQGFLGLLLRAHEKDTVAAAHGLANEVERGLEPGDGLREIDDVNPVALREDVLAHLRVPAPGLVPEVDTRFEQLLHAGGSQEIPPVVPPLHLSSRVDPRGEGTFDQQDRSSVCDGDARTSARARKVYQPGRAAAIGRSLARTPVHHTVPQYSRGPPVVP
jgi:hypothetical protein